jgi:amino acid transporter
VLLTLVNLRGIKESGLIFMLPTYAFVATLALVIVVGFARTLWSGGHPVPVASPPPASAAAEAAGLWLLLRAFASGCTAMTGVEAVSNGVPLFRPPTVRLAQRTLGLIIAVLVFLLAGIAFLCRAYGIAATVPGEAGYQSILSMLVAAVFGRGAFYYATMASIVAVLALSANTSFADFPRLCRVLAEDRFLPGSFVSRGRRLVFSWGITTLAVLSGLLLIVFGGITDRLIPLFAIGAFLAFTLSQAGMVQHWRRVGGPEVRRSILINGLGAVSKFSEGAWITVIIVPLLLFFFDRVNRHYRRIADQIATIMPLQLPKPQAPIVVVAAGTWSKLTQHGLKIALRLSTDVYIVQIRTERDSIQDLGDNWRLLIENPARAAGIPAPKPVTLISDYREFFNPFVEFVLGLERDHPDRDVFVVIPDLVMSHWYESLLHNNRGALLRTLLRRRCGPRVSIIDTPYQLG